MGIGSERLVPHDGEPHTEGAVGAKLNWLRAGVLGANDGLISTAGLVIGVAAASASRDAILTAGIAGLVAGAVSMALGEYVSVSTQRDTERALIAKERGELSADPDDELAELAEIYQMKGLSEATARQVAHELTAHDALAAHVDAELHLDQGDLTSPTAAAVASAVSFSIGAAIPIVASLANWNRIAVIIMAVVAGLIVTGVTSATLGGARRRTAVARIVLGGIIAMAVTYGVGRLLGTTGIG